MTIVDALGDFGIYGTVMWHGILAVFLKRPLGTRRTPCAR
jgi:hypothetical protein